MTQPRCILPNQTLLITRRSVSRHYLFRPDSSINQAFKYCVALAAQETGVVLHAMVLMSTHYHIVLTDTRGVHPLFTRRLNRLFANFTKVLRAWSGEVFNAAGPSVVTLHTSEAILDKIAYTLGNPVAAGAVKRSRDWPGTVTRIEDIGGRACIIKRPARYFSENGSLPGEVTLQFHMPELLGSNKTGERWNEIRDEVARHEAAARTEITKRGWKVAGERKSRTVSPYKRATAYEAFGSRNPTLATKGSGLQGLFDAVEQLRAFRKAYRDALDGWRRGIRSVMFPPGTWLMREFHSARCNDF